MLENSQPRTLRSRVPGLAVFLGFLTLGIVAAAGYVVVMSAIHGRARVIGAPLLSSVRRPGLTAGEIVVGACVGVMILGLFAVLVRDARRPATTDGTEQSSTD